MGVAGHFAGDGAQPEALGRVETGALQPAVIENQALRLPVLEEKLAVVGAHQRVVDERVHPLPVEADPLEEELVGV